MRSVSLVVLAASILLAAPGHAAPSAAMNAAVANPARPAPERLRDKYRHPAETLAFFGVAPGQTLIEFSPGTGWYTHILMPLLAGNGHYTALVRDRQREIDNAKALVATQPGGAAAIVTPFDPAKSMATAGTVDRVLTFRNIHNMFRAEDGGSADGRYAAAFFQAAYKALKPGGILGIEEHRLPENAPAAREVASGYMKQSTVIRLARTAGFRLAGESEVNANPRDTADWPNGVWTLPPTLSQGDKDRAKYLAIGESDRMTLRFVKPK